jgi:hypothetical protein
MSAGGHLPGRRMACYQAAVTKALRHPGGDHRGRVRSPGWQMPILGTKMPKMGMHSKAATKKTPAGWR